MSNFGASKESLLPEDIESSIAKAKETISILQRDILNTNNELITRKSELEVLNTKISEAIIYHDKIMLEAESAKQSMDDRQAKISQRETALDIIANALSEREQKVNKYLSVFERMQDNLK